MPRPFRLAANNAAQIRQNAYSSPRTSYAFFELARSVPRSFAEDQVPVQQGTGKPDCNPSGATAGNGKYNLKPVIRALPQAVSGALTGTVSPIASYPKVYAIMGTDTVGTITDATGKFYFPGLPAGTYRVNFVPLSPYSVKTIDGVVVTNGAVKDMGSVSIQ